MTSLTYSLGRRVTLAFLDHRGETIATDDGVIWGVARCEPARYDVRTADGQLHENVPHARVTLCTAGGETEKSAIDFIPWVSSADALKAEAVARRLSPSIVPHWLRLPVIQTDRAA